MLQQSAMSGAGLRGGCSSEEISMSGGVSTFSEYGIFPADVRGDVGDGCDRGWLVILHHKFLNCESDIAPSMVLTPLV